MIIALFVIVLNAELRRVLILSGFIVDDFDAVTGLIVLERARWGPGVFTVVGDRVDDAGEILGIG